MPWRALLRVIDFQELLTSQAAIAERMGGRGDASPPSHSESQTLREGFNLLAKVLFTQRANMRDLHDIAWLDHVVLAKGHGLAKTWRGARSEETFEALADNRGRLGQLVPRRGSTWASVPVVGVAGLAELKLECGTAGGLRAGAVAHEALLELADEAGTAHASHAEGREFLADVHRLAVAARQIGHESVALVFASSDLESA